MLDKIYLEKLAVRYQTPYLNILREYVQNLFLRSFYTKKNGDKFLFKGGTAMRIAHKSPRFSEDLDFTGLADSKVYEKVMEEAFYDLLSEGLDADIEESKETSGGYLANILISIHDQKILIKNQISFREKSGKNFENMIIVNDYLPAYNIYLLEKKIMVMEKIEALITRSKPRDFFDLHFILANTDLRKAINIDNGIREKIINCIRLQDKRELEYELKQFLPNSFWVIIKDLPNRLITDLSRS